MAEGNYAYISVGTTFQSELFHEPSVVLALVYTEKVPLGIFCIAMYRAMGRFSAASTLMQSVGFRWVSLRGAGVWVGVTFGICQLPHAATTPGTITASKGLGPSKQDLEQQLERRMVARLLVCPASLSWTHD